MSEGNNPTEPPVTLRMSRTRMLGFFIGACVFVLTGVALLHSTSWLGWACIVFFGIGVVVFGAEVVYPSTLSLDSEGFSSRMTLGRSSPQRRWDECGPFRALSGSAKLVVYSTPRSGDGAVRRFNTSVAGGDEGLRTGFGGLNPDELARLLNSYRVADAVRHGRPVAAIDPYEGDVGGFPA